MADREAGDRPAPGVGGVRVAAVLARHEPARRALMRRNGAADHGQRAVLRDGVRRRGARGVGRHDVAALVEVEAEGRVARSCVHDRPTGDAVLADRVRVDRARRLLRDHERLAVRRERHLRRAGAAGAERPRRAGERRELVMAHGEPGDVPAAAGVQDVQDVVVNGQADRPDAARRDRVLKLERVVADAEVRNRVAAGVDGEQLVPADDDRSLRAEVRAGAEAAGRDGARGSERAVVGAREHRDGVPRSRVGERVDVTVVRLPCGACRCGREQERSD